jgi:predicted Zn-dependent peptidase
VHEAFAAQLFGNTPLGRPILGSVASINEITRDQIAGHYAARYTPPDLVVAVAGNVDHDMVTRQVADAFGAALGGDTVPTPPRLAATDHGLAAGTGVRLVPRSIEQANLVLGCAGMSRTDSDRFAVGVLNAALGGGMSSRLFQGVQLRVAAFRHRHVGHLHRLPAGQGR